MLIRLNRFIGSSPRTNAKLLPDNAAQTAQNVDLLSGSITPLRGNSQIQAAIANALSIYLLKDTWLQWTTVVDVCPSPIADTDNRIYFTGTDVPRVTNYTQATTGVGTPPINSYKLGIPAPADGITALPITVSGTVSAYDDGYSSDNTGSLIVTADGTNPILISGTAQAAGVLAQASVTLTLKRDGVTIATQDFNYNSVIGANFDIQTLDNPAAGNHTYTVTCDNPPVVPKYTVSAQLTSLSITVNDASKISVGDTVIIGNNFNTISYVVTAKAVNVLTVDNTSAARPNQNSIYPFNSTVWRLSYEDSTLETRFYVCTWVADVGSIEEEGPPCNPSASIKVGPTQGVQLGSLPAIPAGYNITKLRIYRTNPNSDGTASYQFVEDVASPLPATVDDAVLAESLGETLPTADYSPPPDNMAGLKYLAGGVLAGFSGNVFCPSVPYQPHAYPQAYRITVDYPIVALLPFGSLSTAILTEGRPVLVEGTDPSLYEPLRLDEGYPCMSGRAAVDMTYGGVYPSENGLVLISLQGTELLTRDIYTPKEWAALAPNNMIAGRANDRYVCFHPAGGIIIDPKEPVSRHTTLDFVATACWSDPETNDLYLIVNDNIVQFDADAVNLQTYSWRSKQFVTAPISMGAIFIRGDFTAGIRCKVYADGVLKSDVTYNAEAIARLPTGFRGRMWEIELSGTTRLDSVYLGTSVDEIEAAIAYGA